MGGTRGLGAGPCGGDLARPVGAVGADGGGAWREGPFGGAYAWEEIDILVDAPLALTLSTIWDWADGGGIEGGSMRIGTSGVGLASWLEISPETRSGTRSALGPVGGKMGGFEVMATLGAVDTTGFVATVAAGTGATDGAGGAANVDGTDDTDGADGADGTDGAVGSEDAVGAVGAVDADGAFGTDCIGRAGVAV